MSIMKFIRQELKLLSEKNIKIISPNELAKKIIDKHSDENKKEISVVTQIYKNRKELENEFNIKISEREKERVFDKECMIQLIEYLKQKNITTLSPKEFLEYGNQFARREITLTTIMKQVNHHYHLLEENNIEIIKKERLSNDDLIERIDLLLATISKEKKQFTKNELYIYSKNAGIPVNYKHFESKTFMNLMKKHKLSFKKTKINIVSLLEEFSKSEKVEYYRAKGKKFSSSEIAKELKQEISCKSVLCYTSVLSKLNIPIIDNSFIKNLGLKDIETINKVMQQFLKENIMEFTYSTFHKYRVRLYLNYIEKEKVAAHKQYIKKTFEIKYIERGVSKKQNTSNSKLVDVSKKISQEKIFIKNNKIEIKVVEQLPFFNSSNKFYVVKNTNIYNSWNKYLELYLRELKDKRKSVDIELFKNEKLLINTENKEFFFLLHEKHHARDLKIEDIITITLQEVLSADKVYGVHRQNMMIGFLLYLHAENKLLLPLEFILDNYYRKKKATEEFAILAKKNSIIEIYENEKHNKRLNGNTIKKERLFRFFLLTLNNECIITNINDEYFLLLAQINSTDSDLLKRLFRKLGAKTNEKNEKAKYTYDYYSFMKKNEYSELIKIFNNYLNKKIKLKQTSTPIAFSKKSSGYYCQFLKFLKDFYPSEKINTNFLFKIFDFPDSKYYTYQKYSADVLQSNNSINLLCETFQNTKDYENILNKNKIPYLEPKKTEEKGRNHIEEDEIIHKIDDIVTNRPPQSNYFDNYRVAMDMSWWKHLESVRPFEPLLIKLHLRIPARGATLRLTDRDKVLKYDQNGDIQGFHFVSDKNKNRRTPFIVPNIWRSELSFLKNLVEYNKEYFPKLEKIFPDDVTLKDGIMPLFPDAEGIGEYTNGQHLQYWTKVLIQAQMEFHVEGKTHYNFVYSETVKFPKNLDELNSLTTTQLKTFKRKYDIHSLRHTGITRYIKAGMPLELVRMLSGHSGFNTILTVYYHVNQEELVKNWISRSDISSELDMHSTTKNLIQKEFIDNEFASTNPDQMLAILNKYGFFNLANRLVDEKEGITLETISKSDPKFWKPRTGGICTKQKCPNDLTEECSLCPYFISNYMFISDIGLNTQLSMLRVKKYNDMIIKNREQKKNEENSRLRELARGHIEKFYGWLEILELANKSYTNLSYKNSDLVDRNSELVLYDKKDKNASIYSIYPSLNMNHGYLDTLLKAFKKNINDDETIVDITNEVANKLIRWHASNNTYHEIEDLENEQIVLNFLPQYENLSKDWYHNPNIKEKLERLLTILDSNNKLLEHKNENTLLTK